MIIRIWKNILSSLKLKHNISNVANRDFTPKEQQRGRLTTLNKDKIETKTWQSLTRS